MRDLMVSKKYLAGGAFLTAISFGSTFWALEQKGQIFSAIATKKLAPLDVTLTLLATFFLLQMFSVIANIGKDRLQRILKIRALEKAWLQIFPEKVPSVSVHLSGNFFQAVTGNFPRIAEIHFLSYNEIIQTIAILGFFAHRVVQDQFYVVLVLAPLLMLASAIAGNFRFRAYKDAKIASIQDRSQLMGWLERFFKSSFERSHNDRLFEQDKRRRVAQSAIGNTSLGLWRLERLVFGRETFAAALMDFPYVAGTAVILYFAVVGKLSIEAAVVWLGIVDFLVRASSSVRNLFQLRVERLALQSSTQDLLASLQIDSSGIKKTTACPPPLAIKLTDGTALGLRAAAGLYMIAGANGTGKSTLIKTLGGVHPVPTSWMDSTIESWRSYLKDAFVVIDNHSEVLNSDESIFVMVDGSLNVDAIKKRLLDQLGSCLGVAWFEDLLHLERSWSERTNKQLSSGEKLKVSFVRAVCALDAQTKAIFCDESEVHFDRATQKRFLLSLQILKDTYLVLWISHSQSHTNSNLSTRINLMGYAKTTNRAHCFNAILTARLPGTGQEIFWGAGCETFAPVLRRVRLAHQNMYPNSNFLKQADLHLDCTIGDFKVLDAESTGLGFAVALANLSRIHHGLAPVLPIAASGRVAIDGGVEPVAYLPEKRLAAEEQSIPFFMDTTHVQSIREIPAFLEQWIEGSSSSAN